jgi:polyhydroxybutyrate depolymerase
VTAILEAGTWMRTRTSKLLLWLALAPTVGACGAGGTATQAGGNPPGIGPLRGEDQRGELDVGGLTRSWLLHRPAGHDPKEPVPLVVVLHGGGGNGAGMVRISGFSEAADREGFLVVYPDGTGPFEDRVLTWNAGNCCGYALEHGIDDVAFLDALLDRLQADFSIDESRIYVTGLSNGAMMAYRAACELSERIAAIAPVAGAMEPARCSPERPVSVAAFHGTADEHVLYEGGPPIESADRRHPRVDAPVREAVSFWVGRNACAETSRREERGAVAVETWSPCREGTAVRLTAINGLGHAWPGGRKWAPWADDPGREIDATAAMWAFFREHPRP